MFRLPSAAHKREEGSDLDARSGCSTEADLSGPLAFVDMLQRELPPAAARVGGVAGGRHQAFLLLPAEACGAVVGTRFAHARRVAEEAGGGARVHFVEDVFDACLPPGTGCLRIEAAAAGAVEVARGLLRLRAGQVMGELLGAWRVGAAGGRVRLWRPEAAGLLPTPGTGGARGVTTSYGAGSAAENGRLKQLKAAATAVQLATGGGGGGGRRKAGKAGRRGTAEERERRRQAKAGAGGGEGREEEGLWMLCLNSDGPGAEWTEDGAAGRGQRGGGGAAGGKKAQTGGGGGAGAGRGSRFVGLEVEPASELEGLGAAELARRTRKLGKALRRAEALAGRAAAGERLGRDQARKVARRGELARKLERAEEARRDGAAAA